MERTIKVTGKGVLNLKPDIIVLSISLEGKFKTYDETMQKSADGINYLVSELTKAGIKYEDIKTKNLHIGENKIYVRNENGENYFKKLGYLFSETEKITIDYNNELLSKVFYLLSKLESDIYSCKGIEVVNTNITFSVKDKEKAKNEVLSLAVKDAKEKAKLLALASEVKLGKIIDIDYSWKEINIESDYNFKYDCTGSLEGACAYDADINPDDVILNENVSIIWDIE